jgi:hypothetical protein
MLLPRPLDHHSVASPIFQDEESSPLLSSTSKSQSLSHTRFPHAVFGDALVLIEELGWFENICRETRSGKKV